MKPRRHLQGMTLLEVCTVICIAGVIVAAFVPTFARHLRTSKLAEAAEVLEEMQRVSAVYFATRHDVDGHSHDHCLPSAAGPAPAATSTSAVDVDFSAAETPGAPTWTALGFHPDRPLRYRYTFAPSRSGCDLAPDGSAPFVVFRAEGDLDGDGSRSTFERNAGVDGDGNLVPRDILFVRNRVE